MEREEVWKDIRGFEGSYQVSNKGRIKSVVRKNRLSEKILSPYITKRGYLEVKLCLGGVTFPLSIHRAVAECFIPNPYNLPQVNHKDEDKKNNNADNLEWCTNEYNNMYGTVRERRAFTCSRGVLQKSLDGEIVGDFKSLSEAVKHTGYTKSSIAKCCRGDAESYKGFIWRYKR